MIICAAVCPHPPMLLPQVAQGAASDLDALRSACDEVAGALIAASPDHVVVLGAGPADQGWGTDTGGTLSPYGIDVRAGGGEEMVLPLSLTIGAWLLDRAGWVGRRTYRSVTPAMSYGPAAMATAEHDVAVLVMADGTAKRSTEAPGYLDERAAGFDAAIATALRSGDTATLRALDADLGEQMWATGVPALKLFAAMAEADMARGAGIETRLLYDEAPFGVGYWVADWRPI